MKEKIYDVSINIHIIVTARSKKEVLDYLRPYIERNICDAKMTPMAIDIREVKEFQTDAIFSISPKTKKWKQEKGETK